MPNKKDIKVIDGVRCLSMGTSEFETDFYSFVACSPNCDDMRCHDVYTEGTHKSFKALQEARAKSIPSYREQMKQSSNPRHPGDVYISGVGTSMLMIGKFTLKNGEKKELLICPTRQKDDGLWVSAFSGYVKNQVPDKRFSPIKFTLFNEVHEELLLWDKDDEAIRIDFGIEDDPRRIFDYSGYDIGKRPVGEVEPWPVFGFGYKEFRKSIKANKTGWNRREKLTWLRLMPVIFHASNRGYNGEGHEAFFDERFSNLQIVAVYEIEVDLREVTMTSSETSFQNGKLYEEFFDEQGEGSHLILLPIENIYGNEAYKPDVNSETGLVKVTPPAILSEIFNTRYEEVIPGFKNDTNLWDIPLAVTNGDWVRAKHV